MFAALCVSNNNNNNNTKKNLPNYILADRTATYSIIIVNQNLCVKHFEAVVLYVQLWY